MKLGQQVKLFHIFQTTSVQNFVNVGHQEGDRFKFQSFGD
jgi:hypothetical protein